MPNKDFFKHWAIKISRYIFRQKFLRVMAGPLKGYLWSTSYNYDYILGRYEEAETMQFISWLTPGSVFYDVGANVGFHALVANSIIQTGKIYAFEPLPVARAVFEKHIMLNGEFITKNNISLSPMAVSNEEKEVEFSNDATHSDGNTYISESYVFTGTANKIKVQCQSIDGLIKQGYEKPDIIKIDVEGAEYDVLLGAKQTLQNNKPYILLATHDCHLPGVQQKCVAFLTGLGYHVQHAGSHNKYIDGLDGYVAIHNSKR